jgi:biotin carboxyl carrier protein
VTSFEIDIDGKTRVVSIESTGADRYRVTVDGRAHVVQAIRAGEFGLSLLLGGDDKESDKPGPGLNTPAAAGRTSNVQVAPGGRGQVLVSLNGRTAAMTVNGRRKSRTMGEAGGHAHGAASVVAPMPGRVVRVLVNAGDDVAVRQAVVVVEAMKMENELRTPKAGKVREIAAVPGMSVEAGRVLMVIE